MPFNIFDNATKRKEIFLKAIDNNIKVYARSIFLQGLFFMDRNKIPDQFKLLKINLDYLNSLKDRYNIDIATLALKYVIEKKYIDHVLIGVDNLKQLKENLLIIDNSDTIPHDLIDKIDVKDDLLLNPTNWLTE